MIENILRFVSNYHTQSSVDLKDEFLKLLGLFHLLRFVLKRKEPCLQIKFKCRILSILHDLHDDRCSLLLIVHQLQHQLLIPLKSLVKLLEKDKDREAEVPYEDADDLKGLLGDLHLVYCGNEVTD